MGCPPISIQPWPYWTPRQWTETNSSSRFSGCVERSDWALSCESGGSSPALACVVCQALSHRDRCLHSEKGTHVHIGSVTGRDLVRSRGSSELCSFLKERGTQMVCFLFAWILFGFNCSIGTFPFCMLEMSVQVKNSSSLCPPQRGSPQLQRRKCGKWILYAWVGFDHSVTYLRQGLDV